MKMTGDNFAAFADDFDAAVGELIAAVERHPAVWTRGLPGKWTGGQHTDHVAISLKSMAEPFAAALPALRAGTLAAPPPRGMGQSLFFRLIVEAGWMPRGARTQPFAHPSEHPDHDATIAAIRRDAAQLRAIGEGLSPAERDRLWIQNPFRAAWHYKLPEAMRMQGVHTRHHAKQVAEISTG